MVMLADGEKSHNCLEGDRFPSADMYLSLQSIYRFGLEGAEMKIPKIPTLCACGCGQEINIKPRHEYTGVPNYISGHNPGGFEKGNSSNSGRVFSEEWRNHLSKSAMGNKSNLGRRFSEQWKKHISASIKGCRPLLGRKYSDEWKRQHRKPKFGDKNPCWAGGKKLANARANHKRRKHGFSLVVLNNPYNEPIEYHHIHPALPYVVPCPTRIHKIFGGSAHFQNVNAMLGFKFVVAGEGEYAKG